MLSSILLEDLREIGLPANICKFIKNLLCERRIFSISSEILQAPLTSHKGTS